MTRIKDNRHRPYPHYLYPDETIISYTKLTDDQCKWYGVRVGSWELSAVNYGWFPTGAIMGVIDGRYTDTNNVGAIISGTMGSANIAVTNIEESLNILRANGYIIQIQN